MKKLSFIILLLFPYLLFAQEKNLHVTIVDNDTSDPLENVTIQIKPFDKVFTTDKYGKLSANLAPGQYSLIFSFVGYQTERKEVLIERNESFILQIKMKFSSSLLEGVSVRGVREEDSVARTVKENVMPVTIITSKQIQNRAGNLNEILARQAGVQIRLSGGLGSTSRISVRGLEGKRVQIFIDGNPLNTPDGSLGINDLPVQIIERIEIYKGSVPAYLGGDGLGSAVNVILKHREVSYIDASVSRQSYNTQALGLILKKTFDKQGIEVGAGVFDTRSDNDYTMLSPYQKGLKIKRDHDKYHSLLAGGAIKFHKWWFDEIEIEGAYLLNDKQIQGIQRNIQHVETKGTAGVVAMNLTRSNFANNKLGLKYHLVFVKFKVDFTDTSSYNYTWDGTRVPSIYGRGELGIGPNLSTTNQEEIRQRVNLDYRLNEIFTINLNNTIRYATLDPTDTLGNRYAGHNLFNYPGSLTNSVTGLTMESRLKNDKLLLSAALKHYYNSVEGYNTSIYLTGDPDKVRDNTNTLGYNAGLRYNFSKAFLIKASHEKGVRLPTNAELFGDGVLITPTIYLKPEIAYNNTIGLIFDKTNVNFKRIQVEGNVFYMDVEQLIQLSGNGLALGYVNWAKANIRGADVDVKYDATKNVFTSLNVTYQRLTDTNQYIPGTDDVPNPTYKLAIPNTPQFFANWSIEFHRENLITNSSNTRVVYDGSFVQEYNFGFALSVYDDIKIPSYTIHTISVEQSFQDSRYTVSAEVNNITNEVVLNNFAQPLPGRTFRVKFRYLLLGKKSFNHN